MTYIDEINLDMAEPYFIGFPEPVSHWVLTVLDVAITSLTLFVLYVLAHMLVAHFMDRKGQRELEARLSRMERRGPQ